MNSESRNLLYQTGRVSNILVIVLACLITYLNAVNAGFLALDDIVNLKKFSSMDVPVKELFSLYDNRFFRPLVAITFLFDFSLFGPNPGMFHLVNVLIHICNALLVYYLAIELLGDLAGKDRYALIGALFFALHPVNSEAVLWVGARGDLLTCLFFLMTLILLVKKSTQPTPFVLGCLFLSFLCALFAKESSLCLLVLAPLYFVVEKERIPRKNAVMMSLTIILGALTYFCLRNGVSGTLDNGLGKVISSNKSILTICWDTITAYGFYLRKMAYPLPLNFSISTINKPEGLIFFLVLIPVLAVLFRQRKDTRLPILMVLSGLALPMAVIVGNLTWVPYAERYLYLPLTGISLLIALLYSRFSVKLPFGLMLAGALLIAVPTAQRVNLWADPIAFWQDSVNKTPRFATPRLLLAAELIAGGEPDKARNQLQGALELGLHRDIDRQFAMKVLDALNDSRAD